MEQQVVIDRSPKSNQTARVFLATLAFSKMMHVEAYFSPVYTERLRHMLEQADTLGIFEPNPLWKSALQAFRQLPFDLPRVAGNRSAGSTERENYIKDYGADTIDPDDPLHRFVSAVASRQVDRVVTGLLFAMYPKAVKPYLLNQHQQNKDTLLHLFIRADLDDFLTLTKVPAFQKKAASHNQLYRALVDALIGEMDHVCQQYYQFHDLTVVEGVLPMGRGWYSGYNKRVWEFFLADTAYALDGPMETKLEVLHELALHKDEALEAWNDTKNQLDAFQQERTQAQAEYKDIKRRLGICKRKVEFAENAVDLAQIEYKRMEWRMKRYNITKAEIEQAKREAPGQEGFQETEARFITEHPGATQETEKKRKAAAAKMVKKKQQPKKKQKKAPEEPVEMAEEPLEEPVEEREPSEIVEELVETY